ncbi:MAG: WYL domain-containing protein [Coriobacteriia bacterium]|nr:WYL domain-containing protein [Coriobacteriia bacterium]
MPDLSVQRLEALFALLGSLKRHDVIAIDGLAERLGTDPEALRHDLESLQYVGVPPFGGGDLLPLELDEDGYLEVTGELAALNRPLRLSYEQALALVLALEIAGYEPEDELVGKLSRVAGGVGDAGDAEGAGDASSSAPQLDVFELARMLRVTPAGHTPAIFEAVTQALTESRTLAIRYRRSDGAQTARTIEPWLLFAEGDQWYVTAFCHLRGRAQNFRLSRIESATLEGTQGVRQGEGTQGDGSVRQGDGSLVSCTHETREPSPCLTEPSPCVPSPCLTPCVPSPHALESASLPLARLRFATATAFVARDWPGARVKGQRTGALEVDVPYAPEAGAWFARHVCAGAGQIEVLFPDEARSLVRAWAQSQLDA